MKTIFLSVFFCFLFLFAQSQEIKKQDTLSAKRNYHSHNGFHIELNVSPIYGRLTDQYNDYYRRISGKGIEFEIGTGMNEHWMVALHVLRNFISIAPKVITNTQNINYTVEDGYSVREESYGLTLAYYSMPRDILLSASIGTGRFVSSYEPLNFFFINGKSRYGYSGQVEVGKHWWISDKVGFSLALLGGFTSVGSKLNEPSYYLISSQRVSLIAGIGLH